jgi:predicted transglutaminase-like cysteine proteinase
MEIRRLILAVSALAGAQLGAGQTAHAATGLALMPSTFMLVSTRLPGSCTSPIQPALGGAAQFMPAASSKVQALLGGRVSQLDLISQQQNSAPSSGFAASPALAPAAFAAPSAVVPCSQLVLPSATPFDLNSGLGTRPLAPDDFLASKRLAVKKTVFDAQWNRVRQGGLSRGMATGLLRTVSGAGTRANLAAVNSWTNAHVRFVDDRVQYGRADYWAGARATLRRGSGDCEDIAIAKMQLLSAIGVARSDMYLTIARDLVRNADHALLVVRSEGKYWLLDNATDELLDASRSYDYRPILTYSESGKWLHGY